MKKEELLADMKRLSREGGSSLFTPTEIADFVLQQEMHIRELERRIDACNDIFGEEKVPR